MDHRNGFSIEMALVFNIIHMDSIDVQLADGSVTIDCLSVLHQDLQFFVPYDRFVTRTGYVDLCTTSVMFCATAEISDDANNIHCTKRNAIVYKSSKSYLRAFCIQKY